jgi:membrane protein YdbS with pleckstrin-like domain
MFQEKIDDLKDEYREDPLAFCIVSAEVAIVILLPILGIISIPGIYQEPPNTAPLFASIGLALLFVIWFVVIRPKAVEYLDDS